MKVSKRIVALLLAVVAVIAMFAGCAKKDDTKKDATTDASQIKVGFIFLHDENSTYDKNFIDAVDEATKNLGIKPENVLKKTNISESQDCFNAAQELADEGCTFIFGDSFGHEPFLIEAAKANPNVQFAHATGTSAHTEKLPNFHNAFASIYEGRYLAGIAAGMKLNDMIAKGEFTAADAKIGYVGAFPYAEVISGYTSFFLGARSVCPEATMEVKYTGSWYDEQKENDAATALIANGCKLISQHADSMGAPNACEAANGGKGVPNVSYNQANVADCIKACPNSFLIASRINWAPYFEYAIGAVMKGESFDTDWTGSLATGSVVITAVNEAVAAPGTQAKIDEAMAALKDGSLKVFATDKFTVNGANLTSYMADVDSDPDFTKDTEVIADGCFNESAKDKRSAPYFDIIIDGITVL